MTPSLRRMDLQLRRVMPEAYRFWVQKTPRDEGNARKKTRLKGQVIHAEYPYAEKLDEGYSKQAPDGMSEPTSDFITTKLRQIFRR
jgi:hypothetical protein